MSTERRFKTGLLISVMIHIIILVILGIVGNFMVKQEPNEVIEVAIFQPMGGHEGCSKTEEQVIRTESTPEDIVDEKLKPVENNQANLMPSTNNNENNGNGSGIGVGAGSGSGEGQSSDLNNPAVPPRLVTHVQPNYPAAARKHNIEGTTYVQILVGTNGEVEAVTVNESSGSVELDEAAVAAAEQWLFVAAEDNLGRSMKCYIEVPITFRLK